MAGRVARADASAADEAARRCRRAGAGGGPGPAARAPRGQPRSRPSTRAAARWSTRPRRSTPRLRALDGAPLAHLAAHGHHDRENVLFSRLDLADGPLMAYDVQRLSRPPRHVVLSACDVGRTVVRPGDEILGFTAALLHLGTPTVISSVSRVDDETALAIMTAYHRALSAGSRPAEALAQAADEHAHPVRLLWGGLTGIQRRAGPS